MSGGQSVVKRTSPIRRTRLYFVIIAVLTTITLFFLSYGWNMSVKIYRVSMVHTQAVRLLAGDNTSNTTQPYTGAIREILVRNETNNYNESHPNAISVLYKTSVASVNKPSKHSISGRHSARYGVFAGNDTNAMRKRFPDKIRSDLPTTVTPSDDKGPLIIEKSKIKNLDITHNKDKSDKQLSASVGNINRNTNNTKTSDKIYETKQNKPTSNSSSRSTNYTTGHSQRNLGEINKNKSLESIDKVLIIETNLINTTLNNDKVKPSVVSDKAKPNHSALSSSTTSTIKLSSNSSTTTSTSKPKPLLTNLNHDIQNQKYPMNNIYEREKFKKDAYHRYRAYRYRNRLMDRFKPLDSVGGFARPDWVMDGSGPTSRPDVCNACFKTDFKTILNAPDICKPDTEVDLLMMIASAPKNIAARNVIRKTWGKICNKGSSRIKCVYVFGKHKHDDVNTALVKESQLQHDVIQFEFQDTYANLTFKTMMSLRWASENCAQAKYVMKTDDDMYVNTELLPVLLKGAPNSQFFGGFCWGRSSPHRDRNSKWYVSFKQYSQPFYPQMCSGTGYVMSRDVPKGILEKSKDIPFFYLEDVYVSLCLKKLGIHPVFLTGFSNAKVEYDPCSYRNRVVTSHGLSPEELDIKWASSRRCSLDNQSPSMLYIPRFVR